MLPPSPPCPCSFAPVGQHHAATDPNNDLSEWLTVPLGQCSCSMCAFCMLSSSLLLLACPAAMDVEYGDATCYMGASGGYKRFVAPHRLENGWLTVANNVVANPAAGTPVTLVSNSVAQVCALGARPGATLDALR